MSFRVFCLFTLLLVTTCARVHAQSLEQPDLQRAAREIFDQGRQAFDGGRFAEALEAFERAYTLSGRAELQFDIGVAADRQREDEVALHAFERYLRESVDSPRRDEVEERIAALRAARARAQAKQEEQRRAVEAAAVARAAQSSAQPAAAGRTQADDGKRDDDGGGVLTRWWFWVGASVLVAGGAVAVYAVTRPQQRSDLPVPNTGVVVQTLRFGP